MTTDDHLGDALSALLDGELSDVEVRTAEAHLEGCPACEAERLETAQARAWLRGLPPVEPPIGFYEQLLASGPAEVLPQPAASAPDATVASLADAAAARRRQRRRWQAGVAAMAACAASTLVVLGVMAPHDPSTPPPLGRFIQTHEAEVGAGDPVSELATAAVPIRFGR